MIVVKCINEYIEDGEWKGNQLTLNHVDDRFIITHLNISEQTYIKKELIGYLNTVYIQRLETGFVESCFNYLNSIEENK